MTICHRVFVCALAVWSGLIGTNAQENPARLDSMVPLLDPAKKDTMQLTMLIWACESWTTSPKAYPYLERLDALSAELLAHDTLSGSMDRSRLYCERMLKWSKVEHTIDSVHEGSDRSLDPATKRDIYLMLREALNNTVKYAKAKHIHVCFHTSATQVEFEVKDEGVGMEASARNGHGLNNLHHRAERLRGQLTAGSAPGSGTVITFEAALEPVAHV